MAATRPSPTATPDSEGASSIGIHACVLLSSSRGSGGRRTREDRERVTFEDARRLIVDARARRARLEHARRRRRRRLVERAKRRGLPFVVPEFEVEPQVQVDLTEPR